MLLFVVLVNIGLILGSTTAQESSASLEGQKNVSTLHDDYVDYGADQIQTSSDSSETQYSFPFEEQRARAGAWPTLVDNGRRVGVHRRPLTPKSSAEQGGVFLVEEPRSNHRRNGPRPEGFRSSFQRERSRPEVDKSPVFYNNGRPAHSMGYSYAGYIQRQAKRYPIMMYTLVQCVPCQRAKHLLASSSVMKIGNDNYKSTCTE
ncbi:hypothetical protein TELCIR_19713 [Teladorsagia circumcincta]|uniref:Uncharacterized protein n=1 Tax=Teladorsagia circumcincta TaxID=45464 RepID=A0A2G9TMY7_TELCI|nr:hypothetical protein TELCIR_19713 [Teladorsagia circumcincta]